MVKLLGILKLYYLGKMNLYLEPIYRRGEENVNTSSIETAIKIINLICVEVENDLVKQNAILTTANFISSLHSILKTIPFEISLSVDTKTLDLIINYSSVISFKLDIVRTMREMKLAQILIK